MLDTLFPKVSNKCLQLPVFGPVIEDFVGWLVQQDYTHDRIGAMLMTVRRLDRYLRRKGIHRIDDLSSQMLHRHWKSLRSRVPTEAGAVHVMERFLRLRGVLESCEVSTPTSLQITEYSEYLRDVRGLMPASIKEQLTIVARFLAHIDFDNAPERLTTIDSEVVESFVRKMSRSINRATLRDRIGKFRNFLRFLAAQGKVSSELADQIDLPRVYRFEKLPRTLGWKTVQALLRSIPKATVKGLRDYTMIFLMAAYGLRSCEVAALTLDDVEWKKGLIRIRQTKTNNELNLPLTDEAARTLISYLHRVPRPVGSRHLFFRLYAPIRPISRGALTTAFATWASRSGLGISFKGSHCLRHAYAVHLLKQDASLKTIGDLLGHRSTASTAGYIRLATEELREVGLPVPQTTRKKGGRHED
jgi:integrase/recombinase XerD